jgi:CheY-like chemotaxis protein
MRVFVFDDEPMIRKVFSSFARRRGFDVVAFERAAVCEANGGMCQCSEAERCADVILTDFNMPVMTGLEFIERLRERGCRFRHAALISGYLSPEITERARAIGVEVFAKPVSMRDLEAWLIRCKESVADPRNLTDHYLAGAAGRYIDPISSMSAEGGA